MTYKELQKAAKELGLPYVGVSKRELEESIKTSAIKVEKKPAKTPPVQPSTDTSTEQKAEEIKGNTAIVLDGNREVRRYSLDVHGPKYAKLAQDFIVDRKYTVKYVDVQMMHTCPACGHKWND